MALIIKMPALSPTMTEGGLAKWVVSEGDKIKSGDVIAEIETDKATMELESADDGVIEKILVKEGEENVEVGSNIAVLREEGDEEVKLNEIIKQGIKINVIGRNKGLPADIKKTVKFIQNKTFKNKTITLNLALNYGSKEEIINAFKHLSIKKGLKITINNFENHLYTKNIPDPEILIRTGGTKRLSNFLLWQLAYTEIFFIDKLWPDFNERDFNNIIKKFYNIKRNFGKI